MGNCKKDSFEYLYNSYAAKLANKKSGYTKIIYCVDKYGCINYVDNPVYEISDTYDLILNAQRLLQEDVHQAIKKQVEAEHDVIGYLSFYNKIDFGITALICAERKFVNIFKFLRILLCK